MAPPKSPKPPKAAAAAPKSPKPPKISEERLLWLDAQGKLDGCGEHARAASSLPCACCLRSTALLVCL